MALLEDEQAYEIETLVRIYYQPGAFSEPFLRATFLAQDPDGVGGTASLDVNGEVPLPTGIPITFYGATLGKNVSNIQVIPPGRTAYVVVYFTKYRGFVWAKES